MARTAFSCRRARPTSWRSAWPASPAIPSSGSGWAEQANSTSVGATPSSVSSTTSTCSTARCSRRSLSRLATVTTASTWSGPGEGERLWFLGTLATIRVPGEATDGRFALIEFLFPRGTSPPLHTHPQDESYVVLEGRLTIQAGEQRFELEAGGAAVVTMGVAHTFRVDSDTARGLVLSTPA